MITVLVVDDSAFMRKAISSMLEKDGDIQVVGSARNGQEALDKIRSLDPDVVTLDIEMPVMDGLSALRHIMMEAPRPVLMVSSLTTEGAEDTLKAMELGAVDFIPKQLSKVSLDIVKIEDDLRRKVKTVAKRKFKAIPQARRKSAPARQQAVPSKRRGAQIRDIVAIGVSTGGPPAVQKIISSLQSDFPACVLIAQHMPAAFTGAFAKRLNDVSSLQVKEAQTGDRIEKGRVYIAPGGRHLKINQKVSHIQLEIATEPDDVLYKPSVDVLMESVAGGVGKRGLGVILTGMGKDGLLGIRVLKRKGGKALAQSDSTCVVYGMPRAIVDEGLADGVVDIDDMAESIVAHLYQ